MLLGELLEKPLTLKFSSHRLRGYSETFWKVTGSSKRSSSLGKCMCVCVCVLHCQQNCHLPPFFPLSYQRCLCQLAVQLLEMRQPLLKERRTRTFSGVEGLPEGKDPLTVYVGGPWWRHLRYKSAFPAYRASAKTTVPAHTGQGLLLKCNSPDMMSQFEAPWPSKHRCSISIPCSVQHRGSPPRRKCIAFVISGRSNKNAVDCIAWTT